MIQIWSIITCKLVAMTQLLSFRWKYHDNLFSE